MIYRNLEALVVTPGTGDEPQGDSVEVKSAAYVQTWHQRELSKISFDITPLMDEIRQLTQSRREQKTITLATLLKPSPLTASFAELRDCVEVAAEEPANAT
jgi:hypothetical protein